MGSRQRGRAERGGPRRLRPERLRRGAGPDRVHRGFAHRAGRVGPARLSRLRRPGSKHRRWSLRLRPRDLRASALGPDARRRDADRSLRAAGGSGRMRTPPARRGDRLAGRGHRHRPSGGSTDLASFARQTQRRSGVPLRQPPPVHADHHGPGAMEGAATGHHRGGRADGTGGRVGPGLGHGAGLGTADPGDQHPGRRGRGDLAAALPVVVSRSGDRRGRGPHRGRLADGRHRSVVVAVPSFPGVQGGHADHHGLRVGIHRLSVPEQADGLRGLRGRPAAGHAPRGQGQPAADPGGRDDPLPAWRRVRRRVGHLPLQRPAPRVPDASPAACAS